MMWTDSIENCCDHPSTTILIVEDEAGTRRAMVTLLSSDGYVVQSAGSAEIALQLLGNGPHPDIALVDLDLPGMNGAEFINQLSVVDPGVIPVLITAATGDRVTALLPDGVKYFPKPINIKQLLQFIGQRHSRN